MDVATLIERLASTYRTRLALVDLRTGAQWTFDDVADGARRTGQGLQRLAVPAGTRVGLLGGQDEHDVAHVLCDYGVMAAGRVRVPLDPALSLAEQIAQLRDANAVALVYSPSLHERAEALAAAIAGLIVVTSEDLSGGRGPQPERDVQSAAVEPPEGSALASLSYTGGSTGSPKAVMLTHGNLTRVVHNAIIARGVATGDVMLNVRPVWPIAGIVLLAHLAAGGTVLMGGKFDPKTFLALVERHHVRVTSLVPTQLIRLLNEAEAKGHDLSHLRAVDIGAAAVPAEVFLRAIEMLGPRIGVMYGLTEASFSCYQPPWVLQEGDGAERLRRVRSAGRPLFDVEIAIRSPSGERLVMGEEGEITLRGGNVTQGYWNRPDANAQSFRDGWFRTGDLGHMDADGFLYVTGRLKDVIRSGGKSIVPAEVEAALMDHPAVQDASVVGIPDLEWGEIVAAAVVLKSGRQTTEEELVAWCNEGLSKFKRPRKVRFVVEIPRSHYGKVQRSRIKELLSMPAKGDVDA